MTLSGQTPIGKIKRPGSRTNVFSFVARRVGEGGCVRQRITPTSCPTWKPTSSTTRERFEPRTTRTARSHKRRITGTCSRRSTTARWASTNRCGAIRARSSSQPAAITIISGPTPGHRVRRRVRTRPGFCEWELVVPERRQTNDVAERVRAGGYVVEDAPDGLRTSDPWGTQVYVRAERGR